MIYVENYPGFRQVLAGFGMLTWKTYYAQARIINAVKYRFPFDQYMTLSMFENEYTFAREPFQI